MHRAFVVVSSSISTTASHQCCIHSKEASTTFTRAFTTVPNKLTAYPVIDYILRSKKKPDGVGAYSIPFCDDISSHEYAKIARWFSENVPGVSGQVEKWLGGMPLVHALTLVVACRKASDFEKRIKV
ncbi:uncharacterized protein F5147DRAFT_242746 [Suillus discolor]|uniref:Uncharacterized protein n=1 Tax=Suillus discolor TaxID=1912936 RepID=A0A9P7F5F0_9AGAM|nr:uncharacterized protein F5147DRAFT_242746 [Suillus discolor]KAG2105525.1 hypothetical protein F5147DRAFT_242746 [Suillus discolor]